MFRNIIRKICPFWFFFFATSGYNGGNETRGSTGRVGSGRKETLKMGKGRQRGEGRGGKEGNGSPVGRNFPRQPTQMGSPVPQAPEIIRKTLGKSIFLGRGPQLSSPSQNACEASDQAGEETLSQRKTSHGTSVFKTSGRRITTLHRHHPRSTHQDLQAGSLGVCILPNISMTESGEQRHFITQ